MTGSKGGNPENEELTPLINDKREKKKKQKLMLLFVFLFYTIDIRTPLLTISIWQGGGGGPAGYKSQHTQNHMAPRNDNFQFAT